MEIWELNLLFSWIGCFLTGFSMSQILPFLPLYVEKLGNYSSFDIKIYSGYIFSISFLVSAIISPFWGYLSDIKGRKFMLLRSSLWMSITIFFQGYVSNILQLFLLRALMGLSSGYIPNAIALVASQVPKKSGWALGLLSTGQVTGVIFGPIFGGLIVSYSKIESVFLITSFILFINFLITFFAIKEDKNKLKNNKLLDKKNIFSKISNKKILFTLFTSTFIIQIVNSSIAPIISLYVRDILKIENIYLASGILVSLPGISVLLSASKFGKLNDEIGGQYMLMISLIFCIVCFCVMSFVNTLLGLCIIRFMIGFSDAAMLPAVQTLLVNHSDKNFIGRIFGYNQSFMYLGNVIGPLIGSTFFAISGFKSVCLITAFLIFLNVLQMKFSFESFNKK